MIKSILVYLARRAHAKAHAEYNAYQTQPAGNGWHISIALALLDRVEATAHRVKQVMAA